MCLSSKLLQDLFLNVWKMESSVATQARKTTAVMEIVRVRCETEACVEGCNGKWLVCAEQVLT